MSVDEDQRQKYLLAFKLPKYQIPTNPTTDIIFQRIDIDSVQSPSPLMGEGWVRVDYHFFIPLPFIPSRQSLRLETEGRGALGFGFFNVYFSDLALIFPAIHLMLKQSFHQILLPHPDRCLL